MLADALRRERIVGELNPIRVALEDLLGSEANDRHAHTRELAGDEFTQGDMATRLGVAQRGPPFLTNVDGPRGLANTVDQRSLGEAEVEANQDVLGATADSEHPLDPADSGAVEVGALGHDDQPIVTTGLDACTQVSRLALEAVDQHDAASVRA